MGFSRREIVDSVIAATRQQRSQIGSLVEDYLNITLSEINNPGWAFKRQNLNHLWSFLKGKTTFSTVASQEEYVLPREVDHIIGIRQEETPARLSQVTDEYLYRLVPKPSDSSGNPRFYRVWELDGVATQLSTADTIDVVSASASDAGSSEYTVTVTGYVGGILTTETYELNGTTAVTGSKTFQAREVWVSKRAATNGVITVKENSGGTTLVTLGANERTPRFKIVSLYPIPSSAITMYVEYIRTIPPLVNDSDAPLFPEKFHWIARLGTLAKVYGEYLKDPVLGPIYEDRYASAVRAMVAADTSEPDLIEHLTARDNNITTLAVKRSEDEITE